MTSRDFAFWLQGYLELTPGDPTAPMSGAQVDKVRRHLALVFIHEIDPGMKTVNQRIEDLKQKIHDGAMGLPVPVFPPHPPSCGDPFPGGPLMRC